MSLSDDIESLKKAVLPLEKDTELKSPAFYTREVDLSSKISNIGASVGITSQLDDIQSQGLITVPTDIPTRKLSATWAIEDSDLSWQAPLKPFDNQSATTDMISSVGYVTTTVNSGSWYAMPATTAGVSGAAATYVPHMIVGSGGGSGNFNSAPSATQFTIPAASAAPTITAHTTDGILWCNPNGETGVVAHVWDEYDDEYLPGMELLTWSKKDRSFEVQDHDLMIDDALIDAVNPSTGEMTLIDGSKVRSNSLCVIPIHSWMQFNFDTLQYEDDGGSEVGFFFYTTIDNKCVTTCLVKENVEGEVLRTSTRNALSGLSIKNHEALGLYRTRHDEPLPEETPQFVSIVETQVGTTKDGQPVYTAKLASEAPPHFVANFDSVQFAGFDMEEELAQILSTEISYEMEEEIARENVDRRSFSIDTGNMPEQKAREYLDAIKAEIATRNDEAIRADRKARILECFKREDELKAVEKTVEAAWVDTHAKLKRQFE